MRAALLACLLLSLFAAPAYAGSARVDSSGPLPKVVFTGGSEANQLTVIGVTPSDGSFGYEFTDVEPITAGPGCSGGPNRVTCTITGPFGLGQVSLGGGADTGSVGQGAEGSLVLEGDGGDDTLRARLVDGGPGSDELNDGGGFFGTDFIVAPGDGTDTINGFLGGLPDTLRLREPGTLDMNGNPDEINNVALIVGTDGNDTIIADDRQSWRLGGGGGDDTLVASDVGASLFGGDGADTLTGGAGNDGLNGDSGNDGLEGGAGNDELSGSGGADNLTGGEGDDRLFGHEGIDALLGSAGNDQLFGGSEADGLNGEGGNDRLDGEDGDDVLLSGGDGDDTVDGGAGVDTLAGNLGADILRGGSESDGLFGGPGNDQLDGGDGDDNQLSGGDDDDGVLGGLGIDSLSGDSGDDRLVGGADDDSLNGGAGTDTLLPGLLPAGVGVTVDLGAGTATGAGNDSVAELENVFGSFQDDTLVGNAQANLLDGQGGDDDLVGEDGEDTLRGAGGDDTLKGGLGADTLNGGTNPPGGDEIEFDFVSYADSGGPVVASLASGVAVGEGTDALAEVENLRGSPFGDVLRGDAGPNGLDGGEGDDELEGGASGETFDFLSGDEGDDELDGEDGEDVMTGGVGRDDLDGGAGPDTIGGNEDDDVVVGGADNDVLFGGEGTDTLSFELSSASVTVDLGTGTASGEGSDDLVDPLDGQQTFENVIGGSNNDTLVGNTQANLLDGRGGDDVLRSGGDAAVDDDRCGDGNDSVEADPADVVAADCETVTPFVPAGGPGGSGAPTGPGIPAGPGVLVTVSIAGGTFTVSQNGVVSLPITCPSSSGGCQGFVQLLTAARVPVVVTSVAAARAELSQRRRQVRRRVVKLGQARFSLKAGERRRVRIRLSKKNLRLVRRLGRVRVRARAVVRDSAGNTKRSTRLLTLKAPRPRAKRR